MVIGMYVGVATVGIFVYYYVLDVNPDGHTLVTTNQLMRWGHCAGGDPLFANLKVNNLDYVDYDLSKSRIFFVGRKNEEDVVMALGQGLWVDANHVDIVFPTRSRSSPYEP